MANVEQLDVAVIGSGPAGLAAVMALREAGVMRIAVFEREAEPGGVPRHCGHPPFGWREFRRIESGPVYARRLVSAARSAGVDIRTRHSIISLGAGGALAIATPDGQANILARRVVLATGVREMPRSARLVSGDRPAGVINTGALQAFVYLEHRVPFRRPVIVGTELVSFSALLTCRKAGIHPAAMLEAGGRTTARWPSALAPRLFGVPLHLETRLVAIHGSRQVESVTIVDAAGQQSDIACDGVIFTGRFVPASELIRGSHLLLDLGSDGPVVDQSGRCSDPTYFAAGNLLRAVETAGWSWQEGRRIGAIVARDLAHPSNTGRTVLVERGAGIKLVVPQRLNLPVSGEGLDALQIRVEAAVRGDLTVTAGERTLWRRSMSALPERRILIPLAQLDIPDGVESLRVGIGA